MKFSKKALAILIFILIAVAIGALVFFQSPKKLLGGVRSVSPSSAIIEPAAPSYIGNSSIYLLSANSSYGIYDGAPVFIVNVTVRNDYTPQQPPPNNFNSANSTGKAFFILHANLYDKNGTQINSREFIPPQLHPDYNQVDVSSGETVSLSVYMATPSHEVDHYIMVFGYLGALPVP